jgi:hypothetical protein
MALRHVRFTMRRMMVAVAVMAVVMGTVEGLRRRRESFRRRAIECRQRVSAAIIDEQSARISNRFNHDVRTGTAYNQLVEHYDKLRVKYEQAAARPWWIVSPDHPEPDWPKDVPRR